MLHRLSLALAFVSFIGTDLVAAEPLAEVSYRRRPAFLNGEPTVGVWHLKSGDAISTGDGRAYATAKYPDSTRVSVRPNSKAVFHSGWIDLAEGGLDIDVVSGTKHVEQIETPLGLMKLRATTGTVEFLTQQTATGDATDVRFITKLGTFTWQIPKSTDEISPQITITVDKGDRIRALISRDRKSIEFIVTDGDLAVELGGDATIAFPRASRGRLAWLADKKAIEVTTARGTLEVNDRDGTTSKVAADSSHVIAITDAPPLTAAIPSRRNEAGATPTATAGDANSTAPAESPTKPAYSGKLPLDHPYQRVLREFLAGLTEADLDPGHKELTVSPPSDDKEALFRTWLLSLDRIPRIGRKRSAPSVSAPARLFLLETIEGPEAIMRPPAWPEPLAWFANWNYPGNPYYNSKPLKLRAFVTASVMLIMVDHLQETEPELGVCRTDWMAHHLVLWAYTLPRVRDALPEPVTKAYEAGLRKITERMIRWGPKGESIGMDMAAAVGLYYAGEALADSELQAAAEAYARRMFTDPDFFHPAGYFVSLGGYDASYNGQARYYAVWLAMASDFPFTREPLRRAYRLRSHLCLPEPDGTITGPTHFNTRASRDAYHDQYEWAYRDHAGAMLTDEAAHLMRLPDDEDLQAGGKNRIAEFTTQIRENPGYAKPEELTVRPWSFRPWPNSWSFPNVANYAYDHYRAGSYARRVKLEEESSPLLKLPFEREENFVRTFEKVFTVAKNESFGAIIHTGPVAADTRPGIHKFSGPYGFGGGQLSAFWTPATGSVILGRRAGMNYDRSYDQLDDWRRWPIHAVSGVRHQGEVFTTARIRRPQVEEQVEGQRGRVTVTGAIPVEMLGQGKTLEGPIEYRRTFTISPDKLRVETQLSADGQDKLAELVETIPVYLRDLQRQRKTEPTKIEFKVNGKWQPAEAEYLEGVSAVRTVLSASGMSSRASFCGHSKDTHVGLALLRSRRTAAGLSRPLRTVPSASGMLSRASFCGRWKDTQVWSTLWC